MLGDYNDKLTDSDTDDVFQPLRGPEYRIVTEILADRHEHSYIPFLTLIDHIIVTDRAAERLPVQSVDVVAAEDRIDDYLDRVSDHRPVLSRHLPILAAP